MGDATEIHCGVLNHTTYVGGLALPSGGNSRSVSIPFYRRRSLRIGAERVEARTRDRPSRRYLVSEAEHVVAAFDCESASDVSSVTHPSGTSAPRRASRTSPTADCTSGWSFSKWRPSETDRSAGPTNAKPSSGTSAIASTFSPGRLGLYRASHRHRFVVRRHVHGRDVAPAAVSSGGGAVASRLPS